MHPPNSVSTPKTVHKNRGIKTSGASIKRCMIYASVQLYSEQFTPELICEWSTKGQLSHINPDYVTSSEIEVAQNTHPQ